MATTRILDNGLNVKDDKRLVNASQKLVSGVTADAYSFNTSVQPVMIAGIEENPTLSTVDLITCIRDQNGVNRLCVDNRGMPVPSKEQTIYFGELIPGTYTYDDLATILTNFPTDKTIYLKTWIFSNFSSDSAVHDISIEYNGVNVGDFYIAKGGNSLVVNDFWLQFNKGDTIIITSSGTAATDYIVVNGIVQ